MPHRRLIGLALLLALAVALVVYGERACQAPAWAFWRDSENDGPRISFGSVPCD